MDALNVWLPKYGKLTLGQMVERLEAAEARIERMEEALKPFAALAISSEVRTNYGTQIMATPSGPTWLACGLNLRVDDIRAAFAALAAEGKE